MFWFKKKKVIVDALTIFNDIEDLFPICSAKEMMPQWWKDLPGSVTARTAPPHPRPNINQVFPTMKQCSGFKDLYDNSFILPSWSDYEFVVNKQGTVECTNVPGMGEQLQHQEFQWGMGFPDMAHTKLLGPWCIKGPKNLYWTWMGAQYHRPFDIMIMNAVVEFRYQHETNVNIMLPIPKDETITYSIKAGEPLVHLIPHTDQEVEIRTQVVDMNEWQKNRPFLHSRFHRYHKAIKIGQKQDQPKCPFGFGK